jgi:chaperonin GroEL
MNHDVTALKFDDEAREQIIAGVDVLADAVKVTLGPKGKNVAIFRPGAPPHLTKDGVTVANAVSLKDPFENLGAQLVKEAAQRSAEVAGDGTTTATVLSQAILHEGERLLLSGLDVRQTVAGMERAMLDVCQALEDTRFEIDGTEDLISVATISANGESVIGELIAEAIDTVGEEGAISVEQAKGFDTTLDIVEGTIIDRGFLSPYFVTDQAKGTAELERVVILIYNQTLNSAKSILPALEHVASTNCSLLIIANDVTSEALQTLVLNKMKGSLRVCAVKAPEFGDARTVALQDIASKCGAELLVLDESSMSHQDVSESLGYADKVLVDKNGTVLIGTEGKRDNELVEERTAAAHAAYDAPGATHAERDVARRRLKRLSEGIGIIRVGGATEVEMMERRDRIDDALHSARAAKKEGLQPGGGVALVRAASRCKLKHCGNQSYKLGYEALIRACRAPLSQIVENAGGIPENVLKKIVRARRDIGYDAANDRFGNMIELKIIDPHLVVHSALQHATSVACSILLIGCAVCFTEEQSNDLGFIENL